MKAAEKETRSSLVVPVHSIQALGFSVPNCQRCYEAQECLPLAHSSEPPDNKKVTVRQLMLVLVSRRQGESDHAIMVMRHVRSQM